MLSDIASSIRFRPFSRKRAHVVACEPDSTKISTKGDISTLLTPHFEVNDVIHILVKDLACLWNFPSSYQVITHLTRRSKVPKRELIKTSTIELNKELAANGLILDSDIETALFYIELNVLVSILDDNSVLFGPWELEEFPRGLAKDSASEAAFPTVSNVFPDIGHVEKTLPLTHATFLALTPLTKLQVYKHEGLYRRIYGTSLTAGERELLLKENNYSLFEYTSEGSEGEGKDSSSERVSAPGSPKVDTKKSVARSKRSANLDPNQLDVTENVLPGSGLIPKFSVGAFCKVPNYYATTNLMGITQQNAYYNPADRHLKDLKISPNSLNSTLKQISLLIPSGDQDSYLYKYYYYKHYRGPGTGVYKEAAISSKMNKIKVSDENPEVAKRRPSHLPSYKVMKMRSAPGDKAIKTLLHPVFFKENVDILVQRQRLFTEDFSNMEMLHNNNSFNLLINSYRDVAGETWKTFYKFKLLEFEKLFLMQQQEQRERRKNELMAQQEELRQKSDTQLPTPPELVELLKPDLAHRFTPPTYYPEIMQRLPVELRGELNDPVSQIGKPIRYVARIAEKGTPELISQIEVVKLPNANAIGWDNLRKYRRP